MKMLLTLISVCLIAFAAKSQSVIGTWQLVNKTSCLEDELPEDDPEIAPVVEDLKSMSNGTASVIRFKDDVNGEENLNIMGSRKSYKMSNFLYKIRENNLYILDKKSRLLIGGYEIETLSADSLVFSNASRPCEMYMFVKVSGTK